jgi:hypothetical protein
MTTKLLLNEDKFFPLVKPRRRIVAVDAQLHSFITSVLYVSHWSTSRPRFFTPGKELPVTSEYEAGRPQRKCKHFLEEKNSSTCWESNLNSLVGKPTASHRQLFI